MNNLHTPLEEIFKVANYLTSNERELVSVAYEIAKNAHDGQLRKSGEPYFNHCVATAINIARQKMDVETLCAGLLHDTLEDTEVSRDFIIEKLNAVKDKDLNKNNIKNGEEIVKLVEGVTKLGTLKYNGVERHVESLRKFFIAMADDLRVVVIKLCDRLHNVQTLSHVRPDKQKRIAMETLEIHARLADRLGMGRLKAELEDACFPFVYPDEYKKTINLLNDNYKSNGENLEKIAKNMNEELNVLEVSIEHVDHRVKHLYSLWQKLKKHNYDITKIYDVIALRIIVKDINNCYQALGVIHNLYKPVPGRFKDYIAVPKPNGYKSLHTTIFAGDGSTLEVQIRTQEMHADAEYGIASHLHYKEIGKDMNKEEVQNQIKNKKMSWTRDLLEWQKDVTHHDEFMKNLKQDFFNNRVFVFTPEGDVLDLPDGATPLDFAYQIHSDIGSKALRSYVNGKLVPFSYVLKNNDLIKIETNDKVKPSRKWLEYCKTTVAKRHIRVWLQENGGILDKFLVK